MQLKVHITVFVGLSGRLLMGTQKFLITSVWKEFKILVYSNFKIIMFICLCTHNIEINLGLLEGSLNQVGTFLSYCRN